MLGKLSLAKNILKVRFGKQSPFKLTYAVTYKCNSKCSTCSIWKKKPENELDIIEISKFFQKNKFQWINLTGGEVFLRNDIVDIVKNIPQNNDKIEILSITTNGFLKKKIIENVKEILSYTKRLTLTVSIDGPEDIHNKIRGIKCWKKVVSTLRALKALEKENDKLNVFVGYTISPENAGMLSQTYRAIRKYVPTIRLKDFHINLYHTSDVYYGNKPPDTKINHEKAMKDITIVLKKKTGLDPISVLERKYMSKMEEYMKTGVCPMPCKVLLSSLFMDPKGNIYPCTIMNDNLGNIRDFDFSLDYLLSQSKIEDVLNKIKIGECPGCWTACEAYQTILTNIGKKKRKQPIKVFE